MQTIRSKIIFIVGLFTLLFATACQDAKVKVKFNKSSTTASIKPSGQNPINASSVGAFAGKTVGNNYTIQVKVGGTPIASTLTNAGLGSYRVYTKVVVQ